MIHCRAERKATGGEEEQRKASSDGVKNVESSKKRRRENDRIGETLCECDFAYQCSLVFDLIKKLITKSSNQLPTLIQSRAQKVHAYFKPFRCLLLLGLL